MFDMVAEVKSPGPVPEEVLRFFRKKGLKPAFSYREVWAEEHKLAFTVAKIIELSILDIVQTLADRAIENGTTFEEFRRLVEPSLEKSGWWAAVRAEQRPSRMRLIYDTNIRTARAAGQWERIERTKSVLPFLEFAGTTSLNPRPEHEILVGTLLPADDPWWDTHFPPLGYRCKHGVRQISRREAKTKGGVSAIPKERQVEWQLPSGEKQLLPESVHPQFAYNFGKPGAREKSLDSLLSQKNDEVNR